MQSKKVYVKIHRVKGEVIVAICDKNLLGKTIEDKDVKFEIKEEFFRGELVDVEKALELIEQGTVVNVVGEVIVNALAEKNEVIRLAAIEIAGVPHVQIILG
ncbi:MAG: DUF424 family protein [Thermoproteales archaeon]|nr:DUF424 family protein [Thermoproteales archaeon]